MNDSSAQVSLFWLLIGSITGFNQSWSAAVPAAAVAVEDADLRPAPNVVRNNIGCWRRLMQRLITWGQRHQHPADAVLLAPLATTPFPARVPRARLQARPGFLSTAEIASGTRAGDHRPRRVVARTNPQIRRPSPVALDRVSSGQLAPLDVTYYLQSVCYETWALGAADDYCCLGTAQNLVAQQQLVGAYFWAHEAAVPQRQLRERVLCKQSFKAGTATLTQSEVEQLIDECKLLYRQTLASAAPPVGTAVGRRARAVPSDQDTQLVPTAVAGSAKVMTDAGEHGGEALPESASNRARFAVSATTRTLATDRRCRRVNFMPVATDGVRGTPGPAGVSARAQLFWPTDPALCCRNARTGYPKLTAATAAAETL